MADDKVKEFRESILSKLVIIAEQADLVDAEVSKIHHSRGMVYRSLQPKSGMSIVHSDSHYFMADYIDKNGTQYEIQIRKRERKENTPSLF